MLASLLALGLGATATLAQGTKGLEGHVPGGFEDGGDTMVSAMMMLVGNDNKVYMLDKAENNANLINGHPAMGAVWDMNTRTATTLAVTSNPFCASGMHMPNGSFITFGGNGAIGPTNNPQFDSVYFNQAGQTGVRVLNPLTCTGSDAATNPDCQWYDNPAATHLERQRWYSTAESLGDGSVAVIGGYSNGGYINRNYPVENDPVWQGNASQPTYEFWPSRGGDPPLMQFLVDTGGLNSYPHTFLLASGKMVLQANVSTILWDPTTGEETPLPPMPDNIVRVYPASGATAMMPLTVENNYEQTVIFCGGSDLPNDAWGNYSWPFVNTWEHPASAKCHRLTPEPQDGSQVAYVEDDPMPEGRTMGQFILLPDGTMLVVNGGLNGTAGYSTQTLITLSYSDMPYGMSLASGPVGQPALYNPKAPAGKRWTNAGFDTSPIARLYHSSAILLPDASVLIAGSNPNVDVNTSTIFPTTYKAEIWYPPYFAAAQRPVPTGVPTNISYGGPSFDLTVPPSSYSGAANDAADNSTVVIMRPGFTTHAMNMGQRYLQLNNTYTVNQDGSITLHVAQAPPNPNLFQPGPAWLYVVVNGIPSNGTYVLVGSGQIETQASAPPAELPPSVRLDTAQGTGSGSNPGNGGGATGNNNATTSSSHTGAIVGGIVAAIALVGILGAGFGICITRRRRAAARQQLSGGGPSSYPMGATSKDVGGFVGGMASNRARNSDSSAFVPLQQDNHSTTWTPNTSTYNLNTPYHDEASRGYSMEFDPYHQNAPRMSTNAVRS